MERLDRQVLSVFLTGFLSSMFLLYLLKRADKRSQKLAVELEEPLIPDNKAQEDLQLLFADWAQGIWPGRVNTPKKDTYTP